ncbi:hypothetical protein B0A48_04960 [Cryoendolithus antarcticus]|uniref:Clr5 domain-containing protein n=1 Tax=Cryoendolithus antarcticus TaxID=1507870 RepID=A0A1V8TE99_9PEZI|nr:hypothetical protein B0A48_04960 [Cryoendolithus antarcticus]
MPRLKIHLEPYTDEIRTWIEDEKLTHKEVVKRLTEYHNVKVEPRTLRTFLAEANISTAGSYAKDHDLNARITQLHYRVQCSDTEALRLLAQDGFKVDKRRLQRMRLALGLKQRATALKPSEEGALQMRRELREAKRAEEKVEKMMIRLRAASKRIDAITMELASSEAANRSLTERLHAAERENQVLRMQARGHYDPFYP